MMDLSGGALLALAGFAAGAINAAAGGGSLVTFPALIAVGYPPLVANVTNNVAVSPGYATGAWGYRRELRGQRGRIAPLAAVSAFGSIVGVGLILVSSQQAFEGIVPFLVLAACGLLAAQPAIGRRIGDRTAEGGRPGVGALLGQTLAAVYGGYFGAALGVAVLALLGTFFDDTLQRLNALKALLQLVIGGTAARGVGSRGHRRTCFARGWLGRSTPGQAGERPGAAQRNSGLRGRRRRLALPAVEPSTLLA